MSRAAAFAAQAPLMGVPQAASPPGGQGDWFRGAGGLRLRAAFWTPVEGRDAARGTVVLSPGRTEPIEKYFETIGDFLARGFCVLAHDWRGQGLSARLLPDRVRGHARSAEEFLDDYQRLLAAFEARAPRPWIMVGHSMGGCLNLLTLENGESRFDGALLSSPMLRIKTGKKSLWSARFAARWNVRNGKASDYVMGDPDDVFEHTFEHDGLTHDEHRYELWRQQLYACPHLGLSGPTWGWLLFAIEAGERVLKPKALKRVSIPVCIVQAADDVKVWKQTARWAAKRLGRGRYVEVLNCAHEIMLELDGPRGVFFREFDALADYISPRGDEAAAPAFMSDPTEVTEALAVPDETARDAPAYVALPDEPTPESQPDPSLEPIPAADLFGLGEPAMPEPAEPGPSVEVAPEDATAVESPVIVPSFAPSPAADGEAGDDGRKAGLGNLS